jgi:hypothetical protein
MKIDKKSEKIKPFLKGISLKLLTLPFLIFFSIDSYSHSAFNLKPGQPISSIEYKLIEFIDFDNLIDESGFQFEKYKNKSCIQSTIRGQAVDFYTRPYLSKKQKKSRRNAIKKTYNEINNKYLSPKDPSFNGKMEAAWYSIQGLQTCLVFFDKNLIAIYLPLYEHNIGPDFYMSKPSYTGKHNIEHAESNDKRFAEPSYRVNGYWSHGDIGWEVEYGNEYFMNTYLHYSSKQGIDEIIKYIAGYKGD